MWTPMSPSQALYHGKQLMLTGKDPFCFHITTLCVQSNSIKKWFNKVEKKKQNCPAQSPDPNPIQHRDELEYRLPQNGSK